VRKSVLRDHTLYVFGSLELRRARFDGVDYELSRSTEVPFLFANGVRLARVVNRADTTRVLLELGDHLGSTSMVVDRATGQLVQRDTAYAYGAPESSYRTPEFEEFREDYRFTGKEDDVEVGLVYFGARYYAPLLGRWISADPLAVHAPGEADLNLYAYVHGRALIAVDPVGLDESGGLGENEFLRVIVEELSIHRGIPTGLLRKILDPGVRPTFEVSKKHDAYLVGFNIVRLREGTID